MVFASDGLISSGLFRRNQLSMPVLHGFLRRGIFFRNRSCPPRCPCLTLAQPFVSVSDISPPIYILGVLPSRWGSTRFPGKPLHLIAGKPLIQHVWERCKQCSRLDELIVATDDERIRDAVIAFGGKVAMTSPDHPTGTDRIALVDDRDLPASASQAVGHGRTRQTSAHHHRLTCLGPSGLTQTAAGCPMRGIDPHRMRVLTARRRDGFKPAGLRQRGVQFVCRAQARALSAKARDGLQSLQS